MIINKYCVFIIGIEGIKTEEQQQTVSNDSVAYNVMYVQWVEKSIMMSGC